MAENESITTSKKTGMMGYCPILLAIAALVVAAIGLVRVLNVYRQIIYIGQILISACLLVQGGINLKNGEKNFIKHILYACAVLEALRATILVTIGVNTIVGYVARFILIVLACCCVLTAERVGSGSGEKAAVGIIALEIVLYLVFLFGFPGIMLGRLNRFLPLASVLIAVGIFALVKSSSCQKQSA